MVMGTYITKGVGYFDEPCAKCGGPFAMILGFGNFFKERGFENKPLCNGCKEQVVEDALRDLTVRDTQPPRVGQQ